jgi:hypothetical protein
MILDLFKNQSLYQLSNLISTVMEAWLKRFKCIEYGILSVKKRETTESEAYG